VAATRVRFASHAAAGLLLFVALLVASGHAIGRDDRPAASAPSEHGSGHPRAAHADRDRR
jgi:hypothetical protein